MSKLIGLCGVVALLAVGCSSGGTDHAYFREVYEQRFTYGDEFAELPPELTDEQIDQAIERVCPDGPDGDADLDAADEIGESLAGGISGSSEMGSAIYGAVRASGGCEPYPEEVEPVED